MLGTATKQTLATKAAETGTLVTFCTERLAGLPLAMLGTQGAALLEVGRALGRMLDVMNEHQRVLPPVALQRLVNATKRAFTCRAVVRLVAVYTLRLRACRMHLPLA